MISEEFIKGIKQWFPAEDLPNDYSLVPSREKRMQASEQLVEKTKTRLEQEAKDAADRKIQDDLNRLYSGMDSDSEGEYGYMASAAEVKQDLVEPYRKFITALVDCPMILGFHSLRTHKNADKCCYCPCGRDLKLWRGFHQISLAVCGSSRFSANGLMDHLRQLSFPMGSLQVPCIYHWMTLTYLETLYADFWSPGKGHKALYKMGDAKYRAAEEAEARMELKIRRRLEDELALAQKEKSEAEARATELEKANATSPDLVKDLKRKLKMREDLLVCLGLATRQESGIVLVENAVQVVVLTKEEIENFRVLLQGYLELWKLRYKNEYKNEYPRDVKRIKVQYPTRLPLNEWFQRNSDKGEDNTCLFKDLTEDSVGSFFEKWNVEFEAPIKKVRIKRELNDSMIAVDDGGPTREFLSIVWKQIDDLNVNVKVNGEIKTISLFQEYGNQYFIPPHMDNSSILPNKALVYYRAIGRIFAYCILHNETIAHHVMPNIYINFLFRGISPLDATYKLSDLASHVFEMIPTITQEPCAGQQDIITNFIDNFGDHLEDRDIDVAAIEKDCDLPHNFVDDGSVEKKFRICVYKEYIWSRKKALDSILDGLQLLGFVKPNTQKGSLEPITQKVFIEPNTVLRVMPLKSVEELLFCKQDFDVDDVINNLVVDYDDLDNPAVFSKESQKSVISICSESLERRGILIDILRDRSRADKSFLRDFVWFVTGSDFIQRSTLEIKVEFNYEESAFQESLPVSHTCVKVLKLPGHAYDGNREILEMKLDLSIQNSKICLFDMA